MEFMEWPQESSTAANPAVKDAAYITTSLSLDKGAVDSPPPNMAVISVKLIYLSLIFVVSVIGNSLVLYVISKHLRCTSFTNAFIASLSVSDLLATTTCVPWTFASVINRRWTSGEIGCLLNGLLNNMFGIASTFMITCVAVDRFYILGSVPRATGTPKRLGLITILWSWGIAAFFAIPIQALTVDRGVQDGSNTTSTFYHCMFVFHTVDVQGETAGTRTYGYRVLAIVVCFLAPVSVMVYCCARLRGVVKRTSSQVRPCTTNLSQMWFSTEIRTARTVMLMVVCYVLCRGPYIAMGVVTLLTGTPLTPGADTIGLWLFWSSCAVNPIIYAVQNPIFSELLHIRRQSAYRVETLPNAIPVDRTTESQFQSSSNLAGRVSLERRSNMSNHGGPVSNAFVAAAEIADVARCESFPPFLFYPSTRKGSIMSTITNSTSTTTI